MTTLSIPERAREIAAIENEVVASIMACLCVAFDIPLPKLNEPSLAVRKLLHEKLTLKVAHSERELCAKELERLMKAEEADVAEFRAKGLTDGFVIHKAIVSSRAYRRAADALREGGQKC